MLSDYAGAQLPDACLVCGNVDSQRLYASTYHGPVGEAERYFLANRTATAHGQIVRCRACSFVFTSPRFADDEYDRIYTAVGRTAASDPSFELAKVARFRRLAAIVRSFQPQKVPFLDFGCGDGTFLRVFGSSLGKGFEVGPPSKRRVEDCEIMTGTWAELAGSPVFPPASLDFVVAFDVLEHLPRLEQDMSLLQTVLKPGGLLFVSVPNVNSAVARILRGRWNMLLLEHLWYFSPKTLERLLRRHGFEMIHHRSLAYEAPLAHLATRVAQAFGMKGAFKPGFVSRLVLPIPAGLMLCVFRRREEATA